METPSWRGVVEGTPILTPAGAVPVEQVRAGDTVLAACGEAGVGVAVVEEVSANGYSGQVRTFCTDNGYCVSVTPGQIVFGDVDDKAPADAWETIGLRLLTEDELREKDEGVRRINAGWRSIDAMPIEPRHDAWKRKATQQQSGLWIEAAEVWWEEEPALTPTGHIAQPKMTFHVHVCGITPLSRWLGSCHQYEAACQAAREWQQKFNLASLRITCVFGSRSLYDRLNNQVATYTSLAADALTKWHYVPTIVDSILEAKQNPPPPKGAKTRPRPVPRVEKQNVWPGRVADILDDEYVGKVYSLSVADLHNYVAGGIVVHDACGLFATPLPSS